MKRVKKLDNIQLDNLESGRPLIFMSFLCPKRFDDSFNFVFYIVGEYISCAADTHLATDLTCKR